MGQITLRYLYVLYKQQIYVMLIFPVPIIHNLLVILSLRIVLFVALHYCVYQLDDFIRHLCLLDD